MNNSGWSTYPTFLVYVWLTNSAVTHTKVMDLASRLTTTELAWELCQMLNTVAPVESFSDPARDLLDYAIDQVDWFEIAIELQQQLAEVA